MEVGTRHDHTNAEYNEFWDNENYLVDIVSTFTDDSVDPSIRQQAFDEFMEYMAYNGLDVSELDWHAFRESYDSTH